MGHFPYGRIPFRRLFQIRMLSAKLQVVPYLVIESLDFLHLPHLLRSFQISEALPERIGGSNASNFSKISSSLTVRAASTTVRDGKSDFHPYEAKTASSSFL